MAIKHVKCHAGLDPASRPILDSRFRGNDGWTYIVAGVIIAFFISGTGELSNALFPKWLCGIFFPFRMVLTVTYDTMSWRWAVRCGD
ncbi:MAG: hypothetical protein JRC66_03475 [Deltaproteobacteria bacterium]|nr:hypothetical protein [Deltaproteobacteria bacterium]